MKIQTLKPMSYRLSRNRKLSNRKPLLRWLLLNRDGAIYYSNQRGSLPFTLNFRLYSLPLSPAYATLIETLFFGARASFPFKETCDVGVDARAL